MAAAQRISGISKTTTHCVIGSVHMSIFSQDLYEKNLNKILISPK